MADLSLIHQAIINDDLAGLTTLITNGANANEKFTRQISEQHTGMTPLSLACSFGRIDHVSLLLSHGTDPNFRFASLNTTALMTTAFHGHVEIIKLLLEYGADVNAVDKQQSTCLGYAFAGTRNREVIHLLVKAGVDVNKKNVLGMSSLLLVAGYADDELVDLMLAAGGNPQATNDFGHTALHLAIVGKRDLFKRLARDGVPGADVVNQSLNRRNLDVALQEWSRLNRSTLGNKAPDPEKLALVGQFMMSIGQNMEQENGQAIDEQEAMRRRVEAVCRHREERLRLAREAKKPSLIQRLLSCGASKTPETKANAPTGRPYVPVEPLEDAALEGSSANKVAELKERSAQTLRKLIDAGCEVDQTDRIFGMTPLDMAILNGDVESSAVLIAAGADPKHLMKMLALSDLYYPLLQSDHRTIRDLLQYDDALDINMPFSRFNFTRNTVTGGGGPTDINYDGVTPLGVASHLGDMESATMIIKHGGDVNARSPAGQSALVLAAYGHSSRLVSYLLSLGANKEYCSSAFKSATPLLAALVSRPVDENAKKERHKVAELLIKKGAAIDKELSDGRNVLILAFEQEDMVMVDILLSADLNTNFSLPQGPVRDLARQYQQPNRNVEEILKKIADAVKCMQDKEEAHTSHLNDTVEQQRAFTSVYSNMSRPFANSTLGQSAHNDEVEDSDEEDSDQEQIAVAKPLISKNNQKILNYTPNENDEDEDYSVTFSPVKNSHQAISDEELVDTPSPRPKAKHNNKNAK